MASDTQSNNNIRSSAYEEKSSEGILESPQRFNTFGQMRRSRT